MNRWLSAACDRARRVFCFQMRAPRAASGRAAARRAVGLIALAGAFAASAATAQTQIQTVRVDRIEIEGEQRIEEETIRSFLRIQEGDDVTAREVNDALKRLFATGLFEDARITPFANGTLAVVVVENPVINEVSFEGNRTIDDEVLQAQVRSRSRTAFTRARAESDAQTILDAYRAAGRFSATVEPKIIDRGRNRVDLVFEISEGDEVGVSSVSFVGNSEYSDRRLRGVIQTAESAFWKVFSSSDNYDPDRLEFDKELLRRFYFSRGYADFEVLSAVAELSPERDGFFITFTISEGERYDVGVVEVLSETQNTEAEVFADLVQLDEGDTYNADLVEETVQRMQVRAGEQGIDFIDVRPEARRRRGEDDEPIIDIAFRIIDAPRVFVERIEIQGNTRTLDEVIRREFEFVEGDAFNAFRLQRSQQNIRGLGYFSEVDIDSERGSSSDRVVIVTSVTEQSTGDLTFGVGFSTADSIGGEISLTERNFLGRGQFVRASISATPDRQFFDFRFTEPYFLGRDLRVGFDAFFTETDNEDEVAFDTRRLGFRPRIGFPIDQNSRVDLNYLIQKDSVEDVPVTASPLIQNDEGSRLISSVGYDYQFDRRNNRNEPTEGFIFTIGQDLAGLGGDSFSIKTEASVKGYQSFFREEVVSSLEIAGGAVAGLNGSDDVQVTDRFFLGGDSFRGFQDRSVGPRDENTALIDTNGDGVGDSTQTFDDFLGGKYYAVARADVSFPLGLPEEYGIFGGVFADAGALWGLDDDSYFAFDPATGASREFEIDDGFELRVAIGASLFWSSPFGPIRLNFAHPVVSAESDDDEFFRFTAGTRF